MTRHEAAVAIAHAEAAVVTARWALREVVKAEIAAMPEVGDGEGFRAKVAALAVVLGVPTKLVDDDRQQMAVWEYGPAQWVALSRWVLGFRIEACYPTAMKRGEWSLDDHTLDGALRLALAWLADRDVFVEVRA